MEHTEQIHHKVNKLENWMADIFKQAPHIPENGRKVLVDISPYIALVFGVLGVVALLTAGGLSLVAAVFTFGATLGVTLHIFISLIASILLLMAYKGLAARTKAGWDFAFYSELVGLAGTIVSIVMLYGMNIGGLLSSLISFYILFEIRGHYK